jgi:hypothetical protein
MHKGQQKLRNILYSVSNSKLYKIDSGHIVLKIHGLYV